MRTRATRPGTVPVRSHRRWTVLLWIPALTVCGERSEEPAGDASVEDLFTEVARVELEESANPWTIMALDWTGTNP
ncbi:MAG: hypothetical protein U5R14_00105 [Gemmatimonadota bacterium]|nr:hypothetical protein [Gemmatimonadota bacterium]